MATPQLSPGVLVREVDLTVGRADNVLDNIGAIAGPFPIGPVDDPIDIGVQASTGAGRVAPHPRRLLPSLRHHRRARAHCGKRRRLALVHGFHHGTVDDRSSRHRGPLRRRTGSAQVCSVDFLGLNRGRRTPASRFNGRIVVGQAGIKPATQGL